MLQHNARIRAGRLYTYLWAWLILAQRRNIHINIWKPFSRCCYSDATTSFLTGKASDMAARDAVTNQLKNFAETIKVRAGTKYELCSRITSPQKVRLLILARKMDLLIRNWSMRKLQPLRLNLQSKCETMLVKRNETITAMASSNSRISMKSSKRSSSSLKAYAVSNQRARYLYDVKSRRSSSQFANWTPGSCSEWKQLKTSKCTEMKIMFK